MGQLVHKRNASKAWKQMLNPGLSALLFHGSTVWALKMPGQQVPPPWLREGVPFSLSGSPLHTLNEGGPSSIPGQGTKCHMLQLSIPIPQLKILYATTKKKKDPAGSN